MLPQEERTQTRTRSCAVHGQPFQCLSSSEQIFSIASLAGATKPFSSERRPYLLVDVKSSDADLHAIYMMTYSNESSAAAQY